MYIEEWDGGLNRFLSRNSSPFFKTDARLAFLTIVRFSPSWRKKVQEKQEWNPVFRSARKTYSVFSRMFWLWTNWFCFLHPFGFFLTDKQSLQMEQVFWRYSFIDFIQNTIKSLFNSCYFQFNSITLLWWLNISFKYVCFPFLNKRNLGIFKDNCFKCMFTIR